MKQTFIMTLLSGFLAGEFLAVELVSSPAHAANTIEFKNNMMFVDDESQPQLFGAEVQYFRLRGGSGRNIPRDRVIELWNKALDRLVEMKSNAISFYIPWDFHEYAPGKFDFDGTVDEDGDGNPDYPSRDIKTWLRLIEEHGLRHIMVRPGPYINAEWGHFGFGAVPLWFHEKFPDSHMQNAKGQRAALYSYLDPDFLSASKTWLETVHREVLAPYMGADRPIEFVQLDNETNYQWQTIYNVDYSPRNIGRYQIFLKKRYGSIDKLNEAHQRQWLSFKDVVAPATPGLNIAEDQDWYRFQDEVIHVYLHKIREIWEAMGVREPQVVFTLAESYNATDHGLLPNYKFRNDPGRTGMMTVNLYPKTYDNHDGVLLNQPFKADHDVKAADAANDFYFGKKVEWVLGPEIQGGWWRGTEVTQEARRQTYLTTIGHGLKALFVYYFNEGNNWEYDWEKKQIDPYYQALRQDPRYQSVPADQLPDAFWSELDGIVADNFLAGINTRWILANGGTQSKDLFFDAPLDGNADPRPHFQVLKEIGEKIIEPQGRFLAAATEVTDPICFLKDDASNVPSAIPGLDSWRVNSDWAGGLVAYLMQAGINPRILIWGITPREDIAACRLIVYQDNGLASPELINALKTQLDNGRGVISFLSDGVLNSLTADGAQNATCQKLPDVPLRLNGVRCHIGTGLFYRVAEPIYADFNSDRYAKLTDVPARRALIEGILEELSLTPQIRVKTEGDRAGDRTVAFARQGVDGRKIMVTVKTGQTHGINNRVIWSGARADQLYAVSRLLEGSVFLYQGHELAMRGFSAGLSPNGSDVFFIEPVSEAPVGARKGP